MDKTVKAQLLKLGITIPSWNDDTTHLVIPQQGAPTEVVEAPIAETFVKGACYVFKVADYITNPPTGFNLQESWNKGIPITDNVLYVEVVGIAANMIQFTGRGYNYTDKTILSSFYDHLWLPRKSITILETV